MVKRKGNLADDEEEAFERGRPGRSEATCAASVPKEPKEVKAPKLRRTAEAAEAPEGSREPRAPREPREPREHRDEEICRIKRLGTADLQEGALVMAAVRDVNDEELTLNLPYNNIAFVQRNEASEKGQHAELSLPESFAPGQLVVAVILTAQQVGPQRVRLDASLRPSLVNAGLTAEQLRPNMWLSTAVVGEEEHVLRLDFGVENITGIIKKTEYGEEPVPKAVPKAVPKVGSVVMVSVQKVNSQAGTVKCSLASEPIGNDPLDHSSLKPGMLVSARVRSVVEAKPRQTPGLQVRFCGVTAVIHKHHDGEIEEVEWTKNQKLVARILAVLPETTPVVQLTLLQHLVDWVPQDLSQKAQIGELLVGNILDFQPKYGCRVRAETAEAEGGDFLGFCSMSRLADTDKDIVATSVKPGFQSQYRVLSYNFLDGMLILTRKPADLEDGVLVSVSELSPGQLVTGIVTNVADHGLRVKLSDYVTGYVHLRQLTDVPLASVPKRLQVGSKVKCRVLHVHLKRRQLTLTAKKSLVQSDFQLTNTADAKVNMLLTGYISKMIDAGAIVQFYGGARGLIPVKDWEAEEAPAVGMAQTCRVVFVDKKEDRLLLSLNLEKGRSAAEIAEAEAVKKPQAMHGAVISKLKAIHAGPDGIVVKFKTDQEQLGYIPTPHLSDDLELATKRYREIAAELPVGDLNQAASSSSSLKLPDSAVILARNHIPGFTKDAKDATEKQFHIPSFVLLTLKHSMLLACEAGNFIANDSDLQEGRFYSGFIKEVRDFGALVCVGSWRVTGIAHIFSLARRFVEKASDVIQVGQSVRILVSKVDTEKHRFEADLRPSAVSDKEFLKREAEALRLTLLQKDFAQNVPKKLGSFVPGSIVQAEITQVESYGLVLSVKNAKSLTAVALKENMPEMKPEVGAMHKCAILDYNAETGILDVSLHPELVEKHEEPEVGTELQVLPALSKKSYCICWSRKPAAVVFAPPYAPSTWKYPVKTVLHSADAAKVILCPFPSKEKNKSNQVPRIKRPEEELQPGSPVKMKIKSLRGLEVCCAAPVGLQGHLHATQLVDLGELGDEGVTPLDTVVRKGILEARILRMKRRAGEDKKAKIWHLELTCRPSFMGALGLKDSSEYESALVKWPILTEGMKVAAAVQSVQKSHLWMEVGSGIKGRVALLDCSTDLAALKSPTEHFHHGQVFTARVLRVKSAQKELDLSLLPTKQNRSIARLSKVQDGATAAILQLPGKQWGAAHVTELFDVWAKNPQQRLKVGTYYEVVILDDKAGGDESSAATSRRIEVSLRPSLVRGAKVAAEEQRPSSAKDLQLKQKVSGYVVTAGPQGVFVALSRTLTGRIKLKALSETHILPEAVPKIHPPGSLITDMTVIYISDGKVELSLRTDDGLTAEQLSVGDIVSGRVKKVETYGLFVRLDNSRTDAFIHKSEISDSASTTVDSYKVGTKIAQAKVLKIEGQKIGLTIKPSNFSAEDVEEDGSDSDDVQELLAAAREKMKGKKRKKVKTEETVEVEDQEEIKAPVAKAPKVKAQKKRKQPEKVEENAESEEEPWQPLQTGSSAAFEFADFKVDSATSSDAGAENEEDEDEEDGKKKLSKRQKKAIRKEEEKELRKREEENADGQWADNPRSVEDFERLLLTQGDTSIVWIRYMAFHLKMSDLERARQVAERAVKHVGFSDSKERFNVWVAYMNLECTFGTEKTADAVFSRASSHNDAKQVHMQLARIHERNKKTPLAVKAYETCARKFPQSKKVWIAFLTFLYQNADAEGARKVLPKSLAALPRRKHPVVVSKAAILEYQNGSPDRGRSIFEGLLDSYPKRTDLWAVYFDAHVKAFTPPRVAEPDFNEIRPLFRRCGAMSLKATKMRFFFKRWLDFETKWGDEQSQEEVRTKAREFVESQG